MELRSRMAHNGVMSTDPKGSPTTGLAPGELLGERFRIVSTVGVGGMATVYRAIDESLGRTVALKVFRSELADAEDVRRQRDEVQLLASLNAPGLVTLFDAVAEGGVGDHGRAYLVLEFVDGIDLRTRLLDGAPDAQFVARIGSDVAAALAYIHSRGVVHRDVKPGNILLPHDSSAPGAPLAKLADFGIARLLDDARMTATGTVIGTATYLSPEQAQGVIVGTPSDMYSLGLVLLESLSGERAFLGTAVETVFARLTRDPEIPARIGEPWRSLLSSMTQRESDDRPDAATVAATLADPAFRLALSPEPAPTEVLEPTAATAVLESPAATAVMGSPAAQALPLEPRPRARRRSSAVVGVGVTVLLFIVALIVALVLVRPILSGPEAATPSPTPTESNVGYPDVSGQLGDHLRQLQRSVAP